jgi:hypothetical protein
MRSLLLLSLLLTPCVSTAGTIFIDFELSGSTLHFFGGLLEIPPDGSLSGVMTVALPGTGPTSAAAGPACPPASPRTASAAARRAACSGPSSLPPASR